MQRINSRTAKTWYAKPLDQCRAFKMKPGIVAPN